MRFQVPQFIDIKDKVIGPFTLKQFMYYALAGLVLAPIYFMVDLGLFITLAIPMVGVAVLFAHVRLLGQPFGSVLLHATSYYRSDKLFLWQRAAKVKPMQIRGEEYDGIGAGEAVPVISLQSIEQTLNTQGNVIAEDASDPLLEEEEIFEGKRREVKPKKLDKSQATSTKF